MRQLHTKLAALGLLAGVVACSDPLGVNNRNTPDRARVLAQPADVEKLVADQFNKIHSGTLGTNTTIYPQMLVMGLESYSTLANFCMGPRGAWPRDPINNQRGNPCANEQARAWNDMNIAARSAANGLVASRVPGFTLNGSQPNLNRLRAFANFNMGVALGNLALAYERGPMISDQDDLAALGSAAAFNEKLALVRYDTLMAYAITRLDSALAYATNTTSPMAGIPSTWINGNALAPADFARVIRSYRARFRAGVARNLTERQAVDWDKVIADATNGITANLQLAANPSAGWSVAWPNQSFASTNWHQMPTPIIGMADTSGTYLTWLQTALNDRPQILIRTPDRRFPSGNTRLEQIASSPAVPNATTGFPYFRNRPAGSDSPGEAWAVSMYDHYRHAAFVNASSIGNFPIMTKAEIDMLAAEGHIRRGNLGAAADLVDTYRVRAGLPAVGAPARAALANPIAGGSACVPRIPSGATFNTTACGNLYEAMKWEKRMETAMTGWGQWYFDGRGWNDLPTGTATSYPVPFQELDTRLLPIYNLGGVGKTGGSSASTYGFGG